MTVRRTDRDNQAMTLFPLFETFCSCCDRTVEIPALRAPAKCRPQRYCSEGHPVPQRGFEMCLPGRRYDGRFNLE